MSDRYDLEIRILSQPRYLSVARAAVGAAVEKWGFSDEDSAQVMLAVDEALTNIIRHGYDNRPDGPIWLRLRPTDDSPPSGFELVIDDEARQVDLSTIRGRPLEEIRPGGLGVHIIRQIMDQADYSHRPGGGMRLVMSKKLPETRKEPV